MKFSPTTDLSPEMNSNSAAVQRHTEGYSRLARIAAAGLFTLFAGFLVLAARGELWCDEIWSYKNVLFFYSPAKLLGLRLDNNHLLNSLWMYFLHALGLAGDSGGDFLFRLPAVLGGICSFILIYFISSSLFGKTAAQITAVLTAFSHFFILYYTEARGYGLMMCFSLAAFFCLLKMSEKAEISPISPTSSKQANWHPNIFWQIFAALSLLAHTSAYFFIFSALAAYILFPVISAWKINQETIRGVLSRGISQTPLILFCFFWYAFFCRDLAIGGSPLPSVYPNIVADYWAYILGIKALGLPSAATLLIGLTALILLPMAVLSRQQKRENLPFWILILFLVPLGVVFTTQPKVLVPRYFISSLPFFILLLGNALAFLWQHQRRGFKILAVLLTLLITAGNFSEILPLIRDGRGDYRGLLERIRQDSENSTFDRIRIAADISFGFGSYLSADRYIHWMRHPHNLFLAQTIGDNRRVQPPPEDADYLFVPRIPDQPVPPKVIQKKYQWEQIDFRPGLHESGMDVFLYRRLRTEHSDSSVPNSLTDAE